MFSGASIILNSKFDARNMPDISEMNKQKSQIFLRHS